MFSIKDFTEISSMVCKDAVPYAIGLLADIASRIIEQKNNLSEFSPSYENIQSKVKLDFLIYLKNKLMFETLSEDEKKYFNLNYENDVHRLIGLLNKVLFIIIDNNFSIIIEDKTFVPINKSPV